jgi:1-hydroxycarotenoid 3,4-desaturase
MDVIVIDSAQTPGGKMRAINVDGALIDAGPTVFTMRHVFESLFEDAGCKLSDHLDLVRADVLARHAWTDGGTLDLHADVQRSAEAIAAFAGPGEARGYLDFCARSAAIYQTLRASFIEAQRPSPLELAGRIGWSNLDSLWRTTPFTSLWRELARHFKDPRLQQLFGRYATYVGSSPLLAPATIMLVAHVEQDGVWLIKGGLRRVADALRRIAESHGARFRFGHTVTQVITESGRAVGVLLDNHERLDATSVLWNGDVAALAQGLAGPAVAGTLKAPDTVQRSLSAITWCMRARTSGFKLTHHNVFFGRDYPGEFRAIFGTRTITPRPTVYICAQDRSAEGVFHGTGAERLLVLVNAPADGDTKPLTRTQLETVESAMRSMLDACGLRLETDPGHCVITSPTDFARLFPGTEGALYGLANHGAFASFKREGSKGPLPGLYLAGGSVHPGPGIPMAAMSGRLAAARILRDVGG